MCNVYLYVYTYIYLSTSNYHSLFLHVSLPFIHLMYPEDHSIATDKLYSCRVLHCSALQSRDEHLLL